MEFVMRKVISQSWPRIRIELAEKNIEIVIMSLFHVFKMLMAQKKNVKKTPVKILEMKTKWSDTKKIYWMGLVAN